MVHFGERYGHELTPGQYFKTCALFIYFMEQTSARILRGMLGMSSCVRQHYIAGYIAPVSSKGIHRMCMLSC